MKKIRVGVIGLGLGRHHVAGYAQMEQVDIVALADLDEARLQEVVDRYEVKRGFTDYRDLLKLKPDLVSICLPNFLHAPVAVEVLEAGIHVICEKPMAINAAAAQTMVDAARKARCRLMIALNNRFRPEAQLLKRVITQGRLGEIYYAKTGWVRRRGIPGAGTWFTSKAKAGGGPLIDLGVHVIDLTHWLMGLPEPVAVSGSTYSKFAHTVTGKGTYDVEDLATGLIRFANGATLFAETSWASNIERERLYVELVGSKGGVGWEVGEGRLRLFLELDGILMDATPVYRSATWNDSLVAELTHFVDCVARDKEPLSSGEQGLEMMRILDALYASAAAGKEVKIKRAKRAVKTRKVAGKRG